MSGKSGGNRGPRRVGALVVVAAVAVLAAACGGSGAPSSASSRGAAPASSPGVVVADCLTASRCYAPRQFRVAYGIQPLLDRGIDGRGQTVVGTVERSLFDRLGGIDAITAVVRAVVDRQGKDDRINQKFARTNIDRTIKEFIDQICEATGGPCKYTRRNMLETHRNMGVTNGEFDAFMEDVVAVLDDFKVGKAEQDELLNMLRPMRGEIVEVNSNQIGTPLPSEFTPAPAL